MGDLLVGVHPVKGITASRPKDLFGVLSAYADAHVEVLTVVPVEKDMKVSEIHVCAIGSMMSVSVEARTIFSRSVVGKGGNAIIVSHNHPFQKKAVPSKGDIEFIRGMKSCGSLIGVPLLDSIVVGEESCYSFMDSGEVFDRMPSYKFPEVEVFKMPPLRSVKNNEGVVRGPKDAIHHLRFLREEPEGTMALMQMTPDLEVCSIQVFKDDRSMGPRKFAKAILRELLLVPSTKYFVMGYNCGLSSKRAQYDDTLTDIITHVRLGAALLCIPIMDVLVMMPGSEVYSFMEHGRILQRSRSYVMSDVEGIKLKGSRAGDRMDIPPYSWSFR